MFNFLVGPVFSSGSITQERERKTLGLMLTTLLTPGRIVLAKLLAALRVSTVLTFLLTEQLLLAYALIPELREQFWTLFVYLLIIAATCLITSTVGLMCSALSRRTAVAMVATYLVLLLLFAAPVGINRFLLGFTDIAEDRLAALTVTSPFSAALSVTRARSTGITSSLAPDTSVANVPVLDLPVWTVYLAIAPILCAVLYAVTYVAFRWRWWKAGNTI
jgi:ABC-type transport system involved in multi-copper enzyme maturation permease subunit